MVGTVGTVTTAVRGGELPGEVRVVIRGLPQHFLAYCTEPLAKGAYVLVINNRGARRVDVEPWVHADLDARDGIDHDEE